MWNIFGVPSGKWRPGVSTKKSVVCFLWNGYRHVWNGLPEIGRYNMTKHDNCHHVYDKVSKNKTQQQQQQKHEKDENIQTENIS